MIRVYLDNCCFNRPFDDQTSLSVKLETEAKLFIQNKIKQKEFELVWSYILEQENDDNPFEDRKENILEWNEIAVLDISQNEEVLNKSEIYFNFGFKNKDSIHLACAEYAKSDYFITTDKGILKKAELVRELLKIMNPIDFINILEEFK